MRVSINNEYDKLKSVVVCSAAYYNPDNLVLNNETIKYYAENGGVPSREDILKEQECFWEVLKKYNVNLLIADLVEGAKGQMFTRDLAFAIGNNFFISSMRKENRRLAINGWKKIIDDIDDNIINVPSNVFLEGGDVVVDGNKVYVGISERTTMEGVEFLKSVLGNKYDVIPLKLKSKFLHLDVVFTIINPGLALVYKEGLEQDSYVLLNDFEKILLNEDEQFKLGTNVFVIDRNHIIVNKDHVRLIQEIEKRGVNVIPVVFSETSKDGGAFRCTTCPLERG